MMVAAPRPDAASSLDVLAVFQSSGNHDMTMTRRDFLSASAALRRRRRLAPRAWARAIAARGRHCRDRRRRRRHRRGAAHPGREPQGDRGRGGEPDRRPLPHRHRDLRGAVRSRRALAAQSRHQPDDQARAQRRARHFGGAARPENPHRPPQRAGRRNRGISGRAGARQPRHRRCLARQGRCVLRLGAAEGSRRLGRDGGIRARRQCDRQGPEGRLRRSTRPARRIAMPRSPAARAWAR